MFVRFNSGFLALTHFHICFLGCFHCKTLPHFSLRSYFKSLSARALAHNDDICKVFAPKIQFKIQFIFSFSRINKIYLNSSLYESVSFRRLTLKLKQIHKHHQHHRHHPKKRNRSWRKHHIIITHHCTCTIHRWKCERQKERKYNLWSSSSCCLRSVKFRKHTTKIWGKTNFFGFGIDGGDRITNQ